MRAKKSKREIWRFEFEAARRGRFWRGLAMEQRACAEFITDKTAEVVGRSMKEGGPLPGFFDPKFARMLYGYSLENLAKGLLLSSSDWRHYVDDPEGIPRISFRGKGHKLEWLLGKLGLEYSEEPHLPGIATLPPEKRARVEARHRGVLFYLRVWSISAEWFGKYPFPLSMDGVLDEYESMKSSAALTKRSLAGKREFLESDALHSGIGHEEREAYVRVFSDLEARWEDAERRPGDVK